MFAEIKMQKTKKLFKTPPGWNGRDSIKRSVRLCFHNGPSRGVFERKVLEKQRKKKKLDKIKIDWNMVPNPNLKPTLGNISKQNNWS